VEERESAALRTLLGGWPRQLSSIVADPELYRFARRHRGRVDPLPAVERLLAMTVLLGLGPDVISRARSLAPPELRALDAIHLASALSLGDDLGVFVAYDHRLLTAAQEAGVATASPGA